MLATPENAKLAARAKVAIMMRESMNGGSRDISLRQRFNAELLRGGYKWMNAIVTGLGLGAAGAGGADMQEPTYHGGYGLTSEMMPSSMVTTGGVPSGSMAIGAATDMPMVSNPAVSLSPTPKPSYVIPKSLTETEQLMSMDGKYFAADNRVDIEPSAEDYCYGGNCGDTLGIPRSYMTQVPKTADGKFDVEVLRDFVPDAVYTGRVESIQINQLSAMQKEALSAKITAVSPSPGNKFPGIAASLVMAQEGKSKKFADAKQLANMMNKNPIFVVVDGNGRMWVFDGHHRFFSFKEYNAKAVEKGWPTIDSIPAVTFTLPSGMSARDFLDVTYKAGFPSADLMGDDVDVREVDKKRFDFLKKGLGVDTPDALRGSMM